MLLSRWCSVIDDQLDGRSASHAVIARCRSKRPDSTSDSTTVGRTSLLIEQALNRDRGLHGWLPGPFVSPADRSSTTSDQRSP